MARSWVYGLVAVVGVATAGGAAWWLQSRPQAARPVVAKNAEQSQAPAAARATASRVPGVEAARVEVQSLRDDVQAVGSLRARHSVMLRPELVGRVTALNFRDGGPVRQGQVLVQLDDLLQQADVQQAQAQLGVAEANHKRIQELVEANFMSRQTLDTSGAALKVAQAQLALAQARLARMAVRAPFDGVAGIRLVNVGDYVKDGTDLVALEDTRQMLVDFRLPERHLAKVRPGLPVELSLDALPGQQFRALVEAVEPLLDANGRSVAVRALLNKGADAGARALRSGMFARVTIVFSVDDAALMLPEEAIVPQGGKQFVIKLVPPAAGEAMPPETQWVSQRQEVKLGVRRQGKVQIVEGLAQGERVVVAGQQRLQKDGTAVRVLDLQAKRAASAASAPPAASAQPAASRQAGS